ncbi:MAG TPA: triple tyrosine motif-containing protein [Luteibacter sp.]|uniref:sensor histidine kinase n=1 Tax=Luteibacter sp. TaxID=1886636 RepID=UPI002BCDF1C0|nr:triple tyrosine motif-containing protein [Luteibacter sp.]HVI56014.1 triple tyrosine motif-containing protein [Luteibacter sp.]
MKHALRRWFLRGRTALVSVALFLPGLSGAAAEEIKVPGYVVTFWGASEGAPQNVLNLAQTADGWIWLATNNGLFRFDGHRFSEFDMALAPYHASGQVTDVVPDTAGGLWVLYADTLEAHLGPGGRTVTVPPGLPAKGIDGVFVHGDGRSFAFTDDGLYLLEGQRWVRCDKAGWTLPDAPIKTARTDVDGDMIVTAGEATYRLAKHSQRFVQVMRFDEPIVYSGLLVPDPVGRLWTTYRKYAQVAGVRMPTVPAAVNTNDIAAFDGSGTFWTIQQGCDGLCRASGESAMADMQAGRRPTRESVIPAGTITAVTLMIDATGDVWVGARQGLVRLHRAAVTPVTVFEKRLGWFGVLPSADGSTLVTTYTRGANNQIGVISGDRVEPVTGGGPISALTRLADGSAVLGGDDAIYRLVGKQLETLFARPDAGPSIPVTPVQLVLPATAGRLWLSIRSSGLFLLDGKAWRHVGPAVGFPASYPTAGAIEEDGTTWFGFPEGSLAQLPVGSTSSPMLRQVPAIGGITAISPGKPLLLGGELGMVLLEGNQFKPIELRRHGLLRGVTGIVRTKEGDVWVNALGGLIEIEAHDLARLRTGPPQDLPFRIVTTADGMPGGAQQVRPVPTLNVDANGLLWAAGVSGLVTLDPKALRPDRGVAPTITLMRSGKGVSLLAAGGELAADDRSLDAEMTGLSLTNPGFVDLRYRLLGLDKDWRYAQDNAKVSYPALPPGDFQLEVQARGPSGDWSPSVFSAHVRGRPAFVETVWFAMLLALLALGLGVAGHFYRMSVVRRRHEERAMAKLRERDRIARELHDSMLQGMAGVMLRVTAWGRDARAPEDMRSGFRNVAAQMSSLVLEARARVIALRSVASERMPFPEALRLIGDDHATASSAAFDITVEGPESPLEDVSHLAVLDIMREAIHNAFAHSEASHVQASIRYTDALLIAEVQDNGRGIPDAVLADGRRAGHWGLVTMRERAAEIGATLSIESRAGSTKIILTAPIHPLSRTQSPRMGGHFRAARG